MDVFDYIYTTLINDDKKLYCPEAIFQDQAVEIENYPKDIPYADMTGIDDIQEKDRILTKWNH